MTVYLWCAGGLLVFFLAYAVLIVIFVAPCMLSSRISHDEERWQERQL